MAHTISQLYDFMYDWVSGAIPGVVVHQSHQDYPTPKQGPFLVLSYTGNWSDRGSAPSRMIYERPDLPAPVVHQWRGQLIVYEVLGDGELLHQLVESLADADTLAQFAAQGVSVLRTTGPQIQPALQDSNWRRESVLILELSWARGYEGNTSYFESVDIQQEKS